MKKRILIKAESSVLEAELDNGRVAQALWEAKRALAKKRDPDGRALYAKREWAGWILTGVGD